MPHYYEREVDFLFTINTERIPTPILSPLLPEEKGIQGGGKRLKLSKEFVANELGQACTKLDVKVIAVAPGLIPSEVAQHFYELKAGL